MKHIGHLTIQLGKYFKGNRGDLLKKDTRIIISFHTNSKLEK